MAVQYTAVRVPARRASRALLYLFTVRLHKYIYGLCRDESPSFVKDSTDCVQLYRV